MSVNGKPGTETTALHLQDSILGAASRQMSHSLRVALQKRSVPGWRCVSFDAQIMAPHRLTFSVTLKVLLPEMFSFSSISFTDCKWRLTPDNSSSQGSALNAQNAELHLHSNGPLWRPLLLQVQLCDQAHPVLALLPTPCLIHVNIHRSLWTQLQPAHLSTDIRPFLTNMMIWQMQRNHLVLGETWGVCTSHIITAGVQSAI